MSVDKLPGNKPVDHLPVFSVDNFAYDNFAYANFASYVNCKSL